ncbi:hypothetical protein BSLG_007954 [Batrachochytrium salamandrivorans]|nr:hypothetical protein BASA83_001178 [Batrachochytrium salamandrivorans]KAJ1334799.1 hypothetical protein BSLG_007954 [Batrachochytrium salamandrivorans]
MQTSCRSTSVLTCLTALIAVSGLLVITVQAQGAGTPPSNGSPASGPPACIALDATTPCGPDYAEYPVLQSQFPSISTFNAAVQNNIADLSQVTTSFVDNYGCSSNNVRSMLNVMRYQVSIQCSMVINDAIVAGCTVPSSRPAKGPLLCSAQCTMAGKTTQSVFQNTTACSASPSASILQARSGLITQYSNYCTFASNAIAAGATCTSGATHERDLCGWRNSTTAIPQCSANFNDDCCVALVKASTGGGGSSAPSSSQLGLYIGIAIGGAVFLIIVGLLAVFLIRRRSQSYGSSKGVDRYEQFRTSHRLEEMEVSKPKSSPAALYSPPTNSLPKVTTNPWQSSAVVAVAVAPAATEASSPTPAVQPGSPTNSSPPITMNNLPSTARRTHVLHPYEPTLPDELQLNVGSDIIMVRSFDDGWALGFDPSTSKQGAFPLVCVAEIDDQSTVISAAPTTVLAAPESTISSLRRAEGDVTLNRRTSSQIVSSADRLAVSSLVATSLREKKQRDQRIQEEISATSPSTTALRSDLSTIERRQQEREEEAERLRTEELERQRRREDRERERLQREQERLRLEQDRIDREKDRVQRELLERERGQRETQAAAATSPGAGSGSGSPTRAKQPISKFLADLDQYDDAINGTSGTR